MADRILEIDMKRAAKMISRLLLVFLACAISPLHATQKVAVRDVTSIEGVRENPLIGYGIVVGLNGTGDRRQTLFTTQTLANVMKRLGVQIPPSEVRVNNVAAVFVTASLPSFARSGMTLDVTVSSTGDAKSLEGGVLLLTPLHGADGQVYAEAQGPVSLGGYTAGNSGNTKQVNHPTVGRIPEGGTVERDMAIDLNRMSNLSLLLRNPDFTATRDIAAAINNDFGRVIASPVDSRRITINIGQAGTQSVPELISRIQRLEVALAPPAKVIINERTGTIVMGGDVKLSAVSVIHGSLSIEIQTAFQPSQPNALSTGSTVVIPQTRVRAEDSPTRTIRLSEGANVDELINGLHATGATARDIVAILQAIKASGGLQAELEIL